ILIGARAITIDGNGESVHAQFGHAISDYSAATFSASARLTETSWLTPRAAMVTPNSRFMRDMVRAWWVITRKRVPDISVIWSSMLQKRSTLASSSGASTSSSTQTGAGLTRNTAKISAI